ncbi:MAG: DnaD domain protein [Lachnospiraceae bacterium]|jgi:DnaD/phage-associated family protein|nr:DnaD domain protein [Lachnospiraceae bacterium]
MNSLSVSQDSHAGMTMLSNRFIDEYMTDANDAQIKVYLYLLRCAGTGLPSGISAIADRFNYTEKDILRALQYWDKKHVISMLYDDTGKLVGIRLENLDARAADIISMPETAQPSPAPIPAAPVTAAASSAAEEPVYDKSVITLDQIKAFKQQAETSELVFITEQYLGKPLSSENIRSIIFMTDILQFSTDLIDYLVQYCVDRGKKDFRYIEKVAINWAQAGVSTPKEAAAYAIKYDKNIYTVMNALGRTNAPTQKEASYIQKWFREYGFTPDMVLEACERCALATDKHRFEYTDGILQSWKENGVHTIQDIQDADAAFQKKKTSRGVRSASSSNPFHQFRQNQYDYDELLQKVKIN